MTSEPRRRALVLACAQFADDTLPQLRSPRRDAEVLGATLADPAGSRYEVAERVDVTAHEARLSIEEFFSAARPGDRHLLYISTHGVQDQRGELYFAFQDTQQNRPAATAVSAEWVNDQIRMSRSRTTIVLVDCCFSGAFLRGMRARDSGEANLGLLVRDMPAGTGVAVLTASGETEFSLEESDGRAAAAARPSYFTEAVVAGISSGAADRDNDGRITVDELYDYVYRRVRDGPSPQRPRKMGLGEGEMVVAEVTQRVTEPPLPPEPEPRDMTVLITPEAPLTPWPPIPESATRYHTGPPRGVARPAPAPSRTAALLESATPIPRAQLGPARRRWIGAAVAAALATGGVVYAVSRSPSSTTDTTAGRANPPPSPVAAACGRIIALVDLLTKPYADVATAVRHGVELAVRENNAAHPECPTAFSAVTGVAGLSSRPDVLGVIPAALSPQLAEVMPALDQAHLPVVSPIATDSDLTTRGWATFFRTVASNTDQTGGDARYLTRTLGAKRVVVVTEQTPLNKNTGAAMTTRLNAAATITVPLPADTNSVSEPAQRIADARPDAIYYAGSSRLAGLLLRRLRRNGTAAPFVMPQSWPCRRDQKPADFTTALAGTPTTGLLLTCSCLPNQKIPGGFAARYRTAFGDDPIGFSVMGYDIAGIFLAGFRAGSGDRAAMLRHLHSYHGRGLAGIYQFTGTGDPDPGAVGRWVTANGRVEATPPT